MREVYSFTFLFVACWSEFVFGMVSDIFLIVMRKEWFDVWALNGLVR